MPQGLASSLEVMFFPILILVVLMLVTILPQRKREKQVKQMLSSMKKGDYVRTIGGIVGRLVQVKDDEVILETGPDKVKLVFVKNAIATIIGSEVSADSLSNTADNK